MQLFAVHRPIIGIGGTLPGVSTIRMDDAHLARLATDHLIGLGHTRIAHLTGVRDLDVDFKLPGVRRSGYEAAMRAAGLAVHPDWETVADFTTQGAYAAARRMLATAAVRPTAVFAASDEMAVGAILAARDFGLQVPQDLSVVGMDGHELGAIFGLTTIDQDPHRQGVLAAKIALESLSGAGGDARGGLVPWRVTNREYPTEFIIRTSTAVPPGDSGVRD